MAYCTVDDIQPYLIHVTLSTTSQPTKEEVSKLCDDVSDKLIDPIIRNYVDLPITDRVGLDYLSGGATIWVVAQVLRSLYGLTEQVLQLDTKWDNFLARISTNNAILNKPNTNFPSAKGTTRRTPKYTLDREEDVW